MTTPARTITPKKVQEFPEYLDFERLRAEGIRYIQDLAGDVWTDHNSHDPGITLLELLCYALTDLGYRTNLPIQDLLAQETKQTVDNNFPTAAHVLSCNPLTILDVRKLLIDTEGVRNAWLKVVEESEPARAEPDLGVNPTSLQLKLKPADTDPAIFIIGRYKVLLELDDAYLDQQAATGIDATGKILTEVYKKLHAHRNFCEDYLRIYVLRDEFISLCGEIEIAADASPDEVMENILEGMQEFLSPTIPFYTLTEMLAMGASPDQVFAGRPLNLEKSFGFVDAKRLEEAERRAVIHVSDIYRVLLGTAGITAVKNLRLINHTNGTNPEGEEWVLPLTPDVFRPVLNAEKSINSLTLSKRHVVYGVNAGQVLNVFKKRLANQLKVQKDAKALDLPVPLGTYRGRRTADLNASPEDSLGYHFSIQNDLPAAYGTSQVSFPSRTATPDDFERQAQALQLKGYLLFFDQLLGNYLAQLANVRNLFSTTFDYKNDSVLSGGDLADVAFLNRLLPFLSQEPYPANAYFSEGDIIAKIIDPVTGQRRIYATPAARDAAIAQIILAFDQDSVDIAYPFNEDTNLFSFRIQSRGGHAVVLQSQKTYATEQKAQAAVGTVRFLATLETSYVRHRKLPPEAHAYTFDWIYRTPTDFRQVLREILEDKASYTRRKNQLFSHLLARFAEDFTDYTLLMFGLNKNSNQQPSNETMVRDKANFIQAYPDISRNRSRGFDQLQDPIAYWQGRNVSGIENRLVTMLGFNKRNNKQLNFFEIVPGQRQSVFFRDRREVILLQTPRPKQAAADAIATFRQALQEIVLRPDAFTPFGCNHERVFGFRVLDQDGCVVAVHPDTYGAKQARDAILHYTRLVVRDADRLPLDFVARNKGFYAQVLKADGTHLFRSDLAAPTSQEARLLSLAIRRAAAEASQYEKYHNRNKGFGFRLRHPKNMAVPQAGDLLAIHPNLYPTAGERDQALAATLAYFSENPLRLEIKEVPSRFYWQISLAQDIFFESLHAFKSADQTRAAGTRALALDKKNLHFQVQRQPDATYRVQWIEHRPYPSTQPDEKPREAHIPLAQTQPVATQRQAELIIDKIRSSAAPGAVYVKTMPAQFQARLVLPDETISLQDIRLSGSADEAELAFDEVLEAACQGAWLPVDTINYGCAHGFSLNQVNSDERLATHPYLYDTARERDEVIQEIQSRACAHRILFRAEEVSDSWQFELVCPNNEGGLAVMLREPDASVHATEEESREYFNSAVRILLVNFQASFIQKTGQSGNFSFHLKNDQEDVLANHPESYPDAGDRDAVLEKLLKCLNTMPADDGFSEITDTCRCSDDNPLNAVYQRWQIRDASAQAAVYQRTFSTKAAAQACLNKLTAYYSCHLPDYSEIVLGDGAVMMDGHWLIRDQRHVLWRSPDAYGSPAEARRAFEEMLMPVMTAARNLSNYRICPITDSQMQQTRFRIELLNERNKPIAVSDLFDREILTRQGIGHRHNYARLFPLYHAPQGIYYQLYQAKEQGLAWRSTSAYSTWQEGIDAFLAFADMLRFDCHYHLTGDDTCGWQVALTEVLLEGANSFEVTQAEADTFAWDQVEAFLDRYQATDETQVIYPYVDYTDECRYRFQLVSKAYVIARHPTAFHSSPERENRRDELFWWWQKHLDTKPPAGMLLDNLPQALIHSLKRLENLFVVVETGPAGKIYLLGVRNETTGFPTVFDTEYASEEDLIRDARQMYAEAWLDYKAERLDGKQGFEIRIAAGMEYHQLAGLAEPYEFPKYEVIWESVATYDKASDLKSAYEGCLKLLTQKGNYSRFRAADGSLVLRLTIPDEVLARQPRRYDTLTACCEAAKKALTYVDTEGFHIVEHLLLRPRQVLSVPENESLPWLKDQLLPIQINEIGEQVLTKIRNRQQQTAAAPPDEQEAFEIYIPGSDPYSMTATVVLPYWSRRFRSVDFRQFFENTIRRETPVHVLLNIIWISPRQMQLFENRLACWLHELERPQGFGFAHRTACLIEILKQLTNTFPHAFLTDCNGAPVILDETTID